MTIRATLQTEGEFISLAFDVGPPGAVNDDGPRRSFGPLRLATVDDAMTLLSQFACYMGEPTPEAP